MSHSHGHNHISGNIPLGTVYYLAIALNLAFVVLETAVGLSCSSMGLLSDAGHKMFDVFSLIIALVAFKLASSRPNSRYTYGYRKTSVLISLLNAVLLFVAVLVIVAESIDKFFEPSEVNGAAISWTAAAGILVSGVSALMLMRYQKGDINTRGIFLHMATDSLISMGVVVSGLVISLTGWYWLDPVVSLAIATVILTNTGRLLGESFRMSIDAVPDNINYYDIIGRICACGNVRTVQDLHVWAVSISETALTAKLELEDRSKGRETVTAVREALRNDGIDLVTIETL